MDNSLWKSFNSGDGILPSSSAQWREPLFFAPPSNAFPAVAAPHRMSSKGSFFETFNSFTSLIGNTARMMSTIFSLADNRPYLPPHSTTDDKIWAERVMNDIRTRAAAAAANVVAICSVAAIDVSSGTARAKVSTIINEANHDIAFTHSTGYAKDPHRPRRYR